MGKNRDQWNKQHKINVKKSETGTNIQPQVNTLQANNVVEQKSKVQMNKNLSNQCSTSKAVDVPAIMKINIKSFSEVTKSGLSSQSKQNAFPVQPIAPPSSIQGQQNQLPIEDKNKEDNENDVDSSCVSGLISGDVSSRVSNKLKSIFSKMAEKFKEKNEDELKVLEADLVTFFEDRDLTAADNALKRKMSPPYTPPMLVQEARQQMKNGNLLMAAEFTWAGFSCAVCLMFARLKINIQSHSSTNYLCKILIDCYNGPRSSLRNDKYCANEAHRSFYKRVVLEDLAHNIECVEHFIGQVKPIRSQDLADKLNELMNGNKIIDEDNKVQVQFYSQNHVDFIFGNEREFEWHADNGGREKYYEDLKN